MMDILSIMPDAPDLNQRIAARVRTLRASRALSLETLAARSGVSRSMISLIERGESSPTAVVLEKLATGLGVILGTLFDPVPAADDAPAGPVSRRANQAQWRDPASRYLRRNISPPGLPQPMQIVEVRFPARARVAFETGARDVLIHQQIWILEGALDVTVGRERHRLRTGDCLALTLDQPMLFRNPGSRTTRYAVVACTDAGARR
jgi:transcriptional regulator with XRE-family HTH domain